MNGFPLSVLSWNCLADSYSHGVAENDNTTHATNVLSWSHRSQRIRTILESNDTDLVCLQEVDNFTTFFKPTLESLSYQVEYAQRPGRQDGILIAFKSHLFDLLSSQVVQFDDLAEVKHNTVTTLRPFALRKNNTALILLLCTRGADFRDDHPRDVTFTVCNTHLYWNPNTPAVKFAQVTYLLERLVEQRTPAGLPPHAALLMGDFNSLPNSDVHLAAQRGTRYRLVPRCAKQCAEDAVMRALRRPPGDAQAPVRFLCDATLKKLVRWLRLLGVDAIFEDNAAHNRRTRYNDFNPLFKRARAEHRVLVTTSVAMARRAACPEAYVISQSKTSDDLKMNLAKLLAFYDVKLSREKMFTVCSKCCGRIERSHAEDARVQGQYVPLDRQLSVCLKCHQVYWWNASGRGSSTRAREMGDSLFTFVERVRNAHLEAEEAQERNDQGEQGECTQLWLRYQSAFFAWNGQELDYTNINGMFKGTLDYIFVGGNCNVKSAIRQERFDDSFEAEGRFPNEDWPSDHMLLKCKVEIDSSWQRCGALCRSRSMPSM